jgi:hypothetical protein
VGGGGVCLDNTVYDGGDFGGGLSFGVKIQPVDWFTAVLGGSGGCWIFTKHFYGNCVSGGELAGGGPFVKLLFGSKRIRYELSSRILFGAMDKPKTQIATGLTFALGKKGR